MGRPKKSAAAKHAEPEGESQEVEGEGPARLTEPAPAPKAGAQPNISKAEAVRRALAEGNDSPEDGVGFVKSRYGIDMTRQMFSSYKAQMKARQAKQAGSTKAKPGRKPKDASRAVEGYLAPPPKPRATDGEGDLIASLETLKPLIASYGAEKVKRLVDLLG